MPVECKKTLDAQGRIQGGGGGGGARGGGGAKGAEAPPPLQVNEMRNTHFE